MHQFIHACAGSGKTETIVKRCADVDNQKSRIAITLTLSGQDELEQRLRSSCRLSNVPKVTGWYEFLLTHIIKPYLPLKFPDQLITGFYFPKEKQNNGYIRVCKVDPKRYFLPDGRVHKDYVEELAFEIINEAKGKVEFRLGRIFDEIIIDEVQDISREGLSVLEKLLYSREFDLFIVGDSRQSLIDSSLRSKKNKTADRLGLVKWYEKFENQGLLKIEHLAYTYRFNQAIAAFSDLIFEPTCGFAPTESRFKTCSGHDGIFLVDRKYMESYLETFSPVNLRYNKKSWANLEKVEFQNFGVVKGRTFDRVAIFATKPIQDFIGKGQYLKDKSACGFYVAVTRARYSVAIIMKSVPTTLNSNLGVKIWKPN